MSRMPSHRSMHLYKEVTMFNLSVSGNDCGIELRHPLAFAAVLYRRCVMNKESAARVATQMDFETNTCRGVVRILRKFKGIPSQERLALISQKDWGLGDADIAEIFGMTPAWSADVRRRADEIRAAEYIPMHMEWIDEGLQPSDPEPEELYRRAKEVRRRSERRVPAVLRSYAWRSTGAFVQIGTS